MKKFITTFSLILFFPFFCFGEERTYPSDLLATPIDSPYYNIEGIYIFRIPEMVKGDGIIVEKINNQYHFTPITFTTGPDLEITDFSNYSIVNKPQILKPTHNNEYRLKSSADSIEVLYPYKKGLVGYLILSDGTRWYDLRLIKIKDFFRTLSLDPNGERLHGDDVLFLQKTLLKLGYDIGHDGADSWFGPDTESAVKRFQKDHGFEANGIVNPSLWLKFIEEK